MSSYEALRNKVVSASGLQSVLTEINPASIGFEGNGTVSYRLLATDTISAAIQYHKENPEHRIAILNFASYKNPGGGFLDDSMAQEEYLCYCTNLYKELVRFKDSYYLPHRKTLNRGMYTNTSLLSHWVSVIASAPGVWLAPDDVFAVDILTCAAPNLTSCLRYGGLRSEDMDSYGYSRVDYVMRVLSTYKYHEVILGAFGCGVFKNDPEVIATAFKQAMYHYKFNHVTYAIPDSNSYNYKSFEEVLKNA